MTRATQVTGLLAALACQSAFAATITVNALTDEALPGQGVCQLRQAVESANSDVAVGSCAAGSGADTIDFSVQGTITLSSSLPPIVGPLTIDGPGAGSLTISGAGLYRVFHFQPLSGENLVQNVTIAEGFAELGSACIWHEASSLTLRDVVVRNCVADLAGAGLRIGSGGIGTGRQTVVERSTFRRNQAGSFGGAISHSNFSGNSNSSHLTISDSTFLSNGVVGPSARGGAISVSARPGDTATILRSTFHANQADDGGSAIRLGTGATVIIRHSTISGNTADSDFDGSGNGAVFAAAGVLEFENTIVAGNFDLGDLFPTPDVEVAGTATVTSHGHNFIGDNRGATADFPAGLPNANNDFVGSSAGPIDPLLDNLGDYGGPTLTMMPFEASPVIDQGACPGETADQRGESNPVTGLRIRDMAPDNDADGCDIGAVEFYTSNIFASGFE